MSVLRRAEPTVPAVGRVVRVLLALREAEAGTTLSQLATQTGIAKSTASNLLRTMVREGLLTYEKTGRLYHLGSTMVELGAIAIGRNGPIRRALPEMNALAAETGLTVFAAQRTRDRHFVVVARVGSLKPIRNVIPTGARFPPDSPIMSRIWEAFAPDPAEPPLRRRRYTSATITDPVELARRIDRIRTDGYAVGFGEYLSNYDLVAAPVFGADSRPCLVLALVAGPEDMLDAARARLLGPRLVAAGRRATAASGSRPPTASAEAEQPGMAGRQA